MKQSEKSNAYDRLYLQVPKPQMLQVPEMIFAAVDGKGDPNTSRAYQEALQMLYAFSYAVKMSKKNASCPQGYYEYKVFPLEGLWDGCFTQDGRMQPDGKDDFRWKSMIRQPEFVTKQVFEDFVKVLAVKKPELDFTKLRYFRYEEGECAQILHIGPYDDEPDTIRKLHVYVSENGYEADISNDRRHHEIYLGDPRKAAPEKLKTIIRYPVRKKQD